MVDNHLILTYSHQYDSPADELIAQFIDTGDCFGRITYLRQDRFDNIWKAKFNQGNISCLQAKV